MPVPATFCFLASRHRCTMHLCTHCLALCACSRCLVEQAAMFVTPWRLPRCSLEPPTMSILSCKPTLMSETALHTVCVLLDLTAQNGGASFNVSVSSLTAAWLYASLGDFLLSFKPPSLYAASLHSLFGSLCVLALLGRASCYVCHTLSAAALLAGAADDVYTSLEAAFDVRRSSAHRLCPSYLTGQSGGASFNVLL